MTTRLLTLVETLIASTDSLKRRRQLIDDGIAALTKRDVQPISDELWNIANLTYRNWNWGFTATGINDTSAISLATGRGPDGVPLRFPDLRGNWLRLVNDGGPNADLCRGNNCTDVVLSLLDTWLHGRPRVAAPRTYDEFTLDSMLRPLGGEVDGAWRIEAATGGRLQQFESDRQGFLRLEAVLRDAGHGACAILFQWKGEPLQAEDSAHRWVWDR